MTEEAEIASRRSGATAASVQDDNKKTPKKLQPLSAGLRTRPKDGRRDARRTRRARRPSHWQQKNSLRRAKNLHQVGRQPLTLPSKTPFDLADALRMVADLNRHSVIKAIQLLAEGGESLVGLL